MEEKETTDSGIHMQKGKQKGQVREIPETRQVGFSLGRGWVLEAQEERKKYNRTKGTKVPGACLHLGCASVLPRCLGFLESSPFLLEVPTSAHPFHGTKTPAWPAPAVVSGEQGFRFS